MNRTSKTFSLSLQLPIAMALERTASREGLSPGLKIADIVELYFLSKDNEDLDSEAKADLLLLRQLRDEAIEKMLEIQESDGFSADITLKTFRACQNDGRWLQLYERYVRGNAIVPGNPRKTNANQTIGSRIKSKLAANDLVDDSGKVQRGRAPAGSIIQTFQLLQLK
jgi:hypothetical protein